MTMTPFTADPVASTTPRPVTAATLAPAPLPLPLSPGTPVYPVVGMASPNRHLPCHHRGNMAPTPTPMSTTTTTATGGKPRELAPFLRQLREMLQHERPEILRWTDDGRAFQIHDLETLTHSVLPKYFKHRKYASFQRQLNYFNFRKWTKSRSPTCTFSNPYFLRDAPELMWHIVRKREPHGKDAEGGRKGTATTRATGHQVERKASRHHQRPRQGPTPGVAAKRARAESWDPTTGGHHVRPVADFEPLPLDGWLEIDPDLDDDDDEIEEDEDLFGHGGHAGPRGRSQSADPSFFFAHALEPPPTELYAQLQPHPAPPFQSSSAGLARRTMSANALLPTPALTPLPITDDRSQDRLLEWIDAEFPSMASLQQELDEPASGVRV